ncbi:MAG: chitobiase/beta-hexosaminidase C-terminal domain-containing protein [Opitutaceae bacterium]
MMKYTSTAFCLLFGVCFSTTHATDIYVSPAGLDTNNGADNQSLATLAAAQEKARLYAGKEPVTVWVAGGTYHLDQTLRFSEADSGTAEAPITYRAVPGSVVTLKGSLPLDPMGWEPWKDGIYKQSLKGSALEGRQINQLFMSDERMVRARFPNWDYSNPLRTGDGYLKAGGEDSPSMEKITWNKGTLDERVQEWTYPEKGILHAFHARNWGNFQFHIGRVDAKNRTFHFRDGGWQAQRRERGVGGKGGHSSPFYIENIFEELDVQFEWYHDSDTETFYFKPPTGLDLATVNVEAAILKSLIVVEGAQHLHFEGFRLTQTRATFLEPYEDLARGDWAIHRGGAVYFKDSQNCSVKNFHIEKIGGNGIFVDGFNEEIHISGCLIENTGESAVCFVGSPKAVREYQTWVTGKRGEILDLEPGPKTEDYPRNCSVKNTITRDVGVYGKQTSGVFVSMAMDITIDHVSVYRIARAGITFNDGTWGGLVMSNCDIYDTILDTGEHGPFNSWGRERFWDGSKLKKDWVRLDSLKPNVLRNNRVGNYRSSVSAGNWTIDLDDGSSLYEIYDNLMIGSTLKLRDGYFREVTNNIMVSAVPLGFHVWPDDNSEDVFERNITVVTGSVEGRNSKTRTLLGPVRMPKDIANWGTFDHNLWWNVNQPGFAAGNLVDSLESWQQFQGKHSVVADPMFVDPANRDYRVIPDSPALKLGFKNFPMNQFGHQMTRIMNSMHQFEDLVDVVIRADARGGAIHYTLDGSEPSAQSPIYKDPIRIEENTTVRANTFNQQGSAVGFEDLVAFEKVKEVAHQSWLASLLAGEYVASKNPPKTKVVSEPRRVNWAGMQLVSISDYPDYIDATGGQPTGVFVDTIAKDSPALKPGMIEGDTIIRLNQTEVRQLEDLERALKSAKGEFTVKVFRNYQHHIFKFSL